jgi:hypothetical protein
MKRLAGWYSPGNHWLYHSSAKNGPYLRHLHIVGLNSWVWKCSESIGTCEVRHCKWENQSTSSWRLFNEKSTFYNTQGHASVGNLLAFFLYVEAASASVSVWQTIARQQTQPLNYTCYYVSLSTNASIHAIIQPGILLSSLLESTRGSSLFATLESCGPEVSLLP